MTRAQAAIGCARADVIHWLHRDHELLECARTAQAMAFEDAPDVPAQGRVLREVAEHLGPQRMEEFQIWARKEHFWCELLAQIARVLARYEEFQMRMLNAVEDAVHQKFDQSLPHELGRVEAIRSAVHWAWRHVLASIVAASGAGSLMALLAGGDVRQLLWPIRVIAVLMCPDATDHPAVREHCLEPIARHAGAEVRAVVVERLTQVFPKDPWFAPIQNGPSSV